MFKCDFNDKNANDECVNDDIVDRFLGILDKNFNDALFNFTVMGVHCTKKTGNIRTSLNRNAISKASSLHLT